MGIAAIEITARGVVQGVGFRPFVHRLAVRCGLAGWVENTPGSVVLHIEGDAAALSRFRALFRSEIPPAARVTRLSVRKVSPTGLQGFTIRASRRDGVALSTIPPDIATCPECLRELADPADRRHRYPFTNCTNCGPRFTIVTSLPYDRDRTSMAAFPMCAACRKEYGDPLDRRFHAEPNACPACGPRLSVRGGDGAPVETDDPIGMAAAAILDGSIVAVRGLGGFQLAVDATNDDAVRALRKRKHREEKPFAVMFRDVRSIRAATRIKAADEAILRSPRAPVLLAPARARSPLAPSVSAGLPTAGVFLPYTPLHRMLLDRTDRPLVMTSGNATDEPIAIGNEEAMSRLRGIADLFLLHDREVVQRSDDSVVRRVGRGIYPIRRARGFVPAPVTLPRSFPDVVGLGGELKNTFCFVKGDAAYLSQHIGDLEQTSVRDFYEEAYRFFGRFLDARPRAACHDLHPAYFTTAFADRAGADRLFALQHHKAHIFSALAETGFAGKAVGVAFDGTGYGEDGAIWGGEFFSIDGMEVRRAGHLAYFPLPGGDAAVREPWRTALSLLRETLGATEAEPAARELFPGIPRDSVRLVLEALEKKINVVPTSSAGRLFDAVSAICGLCVRSSYEGQAPMRLEGAAARAAAGTYPFTLASAGGQLTVDWSELVRGTVADARRRLPAGTISRRFHDTLAAAIVAAASRLAESAGARHVVLSGGVFQNVTLLSRVLSGLRKRKLSPLIHRQVPANDGGISLGQAYYAAAQVAGG
ncbi:MAG: carbamoyltransferase HypF [Deltaproteobacteria bacterium]|nr:carbamoyltransferase HypF [Deltaproteobacteria bacterium]